MSEMAEAIRELIEEKGYSEDQVKLIIENALKAAYKRTFGTSENAVVTFLDDMSDVLLYSRKVVVDGVYDPVTEIELEEASALSDELELGDEVDIPINPRTFERSAVSTGKQSARQGLSESLKDRLYNEYKDRVGRVVTGSYQREYNGSIYVDMGRVEGVIPKKYQSPRDVFSSGERIKAYCVELRRQTNNVQLVLSRTDSGLVKSILETEVPEINDGTVEIFKVAREAGYRSKVAVLSHKEEVDPVGACVGQKGMRIQSVINELYGERVDVLEYSANPVVFIRNALSPAQVARVVLTDTDKRQALAIVPDQQFSLAIGTKGQNVRLANRLTDWSIDVKTESECADIDLSVYDTRKAAESLFSSSGEENDEITNVSELPGVDRRVAALLHESGIDDIQQYVTAEQDGVVKGIAGITDDDIAALNAIIRNTVEFVEEPEDEAPVSEEEYFCPECGAKITLDMTKCPNCGVEFEFEEE